MIVAWAKMRKISVSLLRTRFDGAELQASSGQARTQPEFELALSNLQ